MTSGGVGTVVEGREGKRWEEMESGTRKAASPGALHGADVSHRSLYPVS